MLSIFFSNYLLIISSFRILFFVIGCPDPSQIHVRVRDCGFRLLKLRGGNSVVSQFGHCGAADVAGLEIY